MKVKLFGLMVLCMLVSAGWAQVWSVDWVGPVNGSGLWSDADNWYPPIVPNNTMEEQFQVNIMMDPQYHTPVITLDMNVEIESLSVDSTVRIFSDLPRGTRTLRVKYDINSMFGYLWLEGVRLENSNTISGYVRICDSTLSQWNTSQGLAIVLGTSGIGTLENTGIVRCLSGSVLYADMFNNQGTLELHDAVFETHHSENGPGSIVGSGKAFISGPSGTQNGGLICSKGGHLYIAGDLYNGTFNNDGTLRSNSGSNLEIEFESIENHQDVIVMPESSMTLTCTNSFTNHQNVIVMPNSSLTLACTNGFTNQSRVEVKKGGVLAVHGDMPYPGPGGRLNHSGQLYLSEGHVQADLQLEQSSTLHCMSSTIDGDVHLMNPSDVRFSGNCFIHGGLDVDPSSTLVVREGVLQVDGPVMNHGTIRLEGGAIIPGDEFLIVGTVIVEPSQYRNVSDYNQDGVVNLVDYSIFGNQWLWSSVYVN